MFTLRQATSGRHAGLDPSLTFFQNWAARLGLSPKELCDGVAAVLDFSRRNRFLLDRDGRIFSKIWQEGDREIANGYLPLVRGGPKGLKLRRDPGDEPSRVTQWLGNRPTSMTQAVERWGGSTDRMWRSSCKNCGRL
jgi:hypothetical protein